MAMRDDTRRELRMLRQVVWSELEGKICPFCGNGLLPDWEVNFGHGDAPECFIELTIHHKNGIDTDHRPENRQTVHRACHKAHHMSAQRRSGVTVNG